HPTATATDGTGCNLGKLTGRDEGREEGVPVFFFQAEDGIRDKLVTGVQTCALPISQDAESGDRGRRSFSRCYRPYGRGSGSHQRSEERRVGKECRSQRWA